jgi:hypothetical protein
MFLELVQEINSLKKELEEERRRSKALEEKLFLHLETGIANINRQTFRSYVMAAIGRKDTDAEWRHFISTFSCHTDVDRRMYEWIDRYIPRLKIEWEEWS